MRWHEFQFFAHLWNTGLYQILFCELEWFPSYMLTGDRRFLFTFDCIWYRVVEHSSNGYIHNTFLHLRLREHWGQVQRDCKSQEIKEFAVCCEIVLPSSVRSYTYKVSPAWLPKPELNKGNIYRHTTVDRERSRPQPYTKKYRKLSN